ncbi:MAG: DUF3793 family protein, partial [Solobacterium sp.]|nr:DUF3793 family protein [Solobacterium sp.]
ILPLQYAEGRGLIYVYRPGRLSKDLQDCQACRLLKQCGYPGFDEIEDIENVDMAAFEIS